MPNQIELFMQEAIELSRLSLDNPTFGPFGAIIVKDGLVVGRGHNQVIANSDPTAHAEVMAIRDACQSLETFELDDCEIYSSCEPCPMCLGAIYWSRIHKIYYANTARDADELGFSDVDLYHQFQLPIERRAIPSVQIMHENALAIFEEWKRTPGKRLY